MELNISSLIDNINIGIQIWDSEGVLRYVNDGMVRLSKVSKERFLNRKYSDFLTKNQISISEMVFKEKRPITLFQDITIDDNVTYRQLVTSTPVFDASGNVRNIIAVVERESDMEARLRVAHNSEVSLTTFPLDGFVSDNNSIIAQSAQMQAVLELAQQVAKVDSSVLILGESGVGKEVIAQYIHSCSNRAKMPMVEINCASLPEPLLEAELFGYTKGAFTGASATGKQGLIESADNGILFLDEINSMPIGIQSKLLRAIETKEVRRIGAVASKKVNFQVLTATNQNLYKMVEDGKFRRDLYYRLNVIPITIPPLRERTQDIIPLVDFFTKRLGKQYGKTKSFSSKAYNQFLTYYWPGNARELRNMIERLIVTTADDVTQIANIPTSFFETKETSAQSYPADTLLYTSPTSSDILSAIESDDFSLEEYIDQFEKQILKVVLSKYKSSYKAAAVLKIGQSTVVRKKQKHGLQ